MRQRPASASVGARPHGGRLSRRHSSGCLANYSVITVFGITIPRQAISFTNNDNYFGEMFCSVLINCNTFLVVNGVVLVIKKICEYIPVYFSN